MANKRKLSVEQVKQIHDEMTANGWTLVQAAEKNSVKPGMDHVTLWTNLVRDGLIQPKRRKAKVAVEA